MSAPWRAVLAHPLNILLLGAPLALIAELQHWAPTLLFFASGLAIMPLARLIGQATEELAGRLGPTAGGLHNATFGNATELIIAIVALNAGLFELVKASLTGSILGNVLAVLGLSFLLGGANRPMQRFDALTAGVEGTQLALASAALVIPSVLVASSGIKHDEIEGLSVASAICLLLAYAAGIAFSLKRQARVYNDEDEEVMHGPGLGIRHAIILLVGATVLVGVQSEWLVSGVHGMTASLGWSQLFVGVVVVALIGNAAEHASAVTAAQRDHIDLSLTIALGSATQIALFVAPVLVLVGLVIGRELTLLFETFEVAAVVVATATVNLAIRDGESTWLEGVQLLVVYAVLAIAFFVHP